MIISASFAALPAQAQEDVQRVAVGSRARPDYDPAPLPLGPFTLLPSVTATVSADDNIFASDADRRFDVIGTITPAVDAALSTPLYDARIGLSADVTRYLDTPSENREAFRASARANYGRGTDWLLRTAVDFERRAEQRRNLGSFSSAAEPTRLSSTTTLLGATRQFGSLSLMLEGRARRVAYSRGRDPAGNPIDYAFRNFRTYQVRGGAGYSLTGSDRLTVGAAYNRRIYDLRPGDVGFDPLTRTDRTSSGGQIELGYARQISALLYLQLSAGYLRQTFADPRLRTISGAAFNADLLWNATPLTSVRANVARAVDETASPLTAGNLRSEGQLAIDHELLRNLILSGSVRYANINPSGLADTSDELDFVGSARYLFSRRLEFTAEIARYARYSDNRAIAFEENVATAGISFRF